MTFVFLDNGKCLGWRENISKPFQWIHYNETLLRARNFGSGLMGLGLPKVNQIFIGIFSQNCPEWILTEQAAYCFSMVIVPLYDTLGPEACSFIITQGMFIVIVLMKNIIIMRLSLIIILYIKNIFKPIYTTNINIGDQGFEDNRLA